MSSDQGASAADFAALARSLAEADGFQPTLELAVKGAVTVVPADWAAIAVSAHLSHEPAKLSTTTDPALGAVIAGIAGSAGDSPGIEAFGSGGPVHCPDLAHEPRFAGYAARMVLETPVRSVLSVPLRLRDVTVGVLTLYAAQERAFTDDAIERARLLAEHTAVALAVHLSEDRADNFEAALNNSRTIGAAVGILTERLKVPPAHAFEKLRAASQQSNRKISDLAVELTETGTLPGAIGDLLDRT